MFTWKILNDDYYLGKYIIAVNIEARHVLRSRAYCLPLKGKYFRLSNLSQNKIDNWEFV
jgi:hypothetical protein